MGLVALVFGGKAVLSGDDDRASSAGELVARGQECTRTSPQPFASLPAGLTYTDVPTQVVSPFLTAMPPGFSSLIQFKEVMSGGTAKAVVLAVALGDNEADQSDFRTGLLTSAGAQTGVEPQSTEISGHPADIVTTASETVVVSFSGCYGMVSFAKTPDDAVNVEQIILSALGSAGSNPGTLN